MKRFFVLLVPLLAVMIGSAYALPTNGSTKSSCGCVDCKCPNCNGESCTCDVCACGTCVCVK